MSFLGAGHYSNDGYSADVEPLSELGVPIFNNYIEDTDDKEFYFRYHHSAGDSILMMNSDDLDSNVVGIAAFLYIIADLNQTVRNVTSSPSTPSTPYIKNNLRHFEYNQQ